MTPLLAVGRHASQGSQGSSTLLQCRAASSSPDHVPAHRAARRTGRAVPRSGLCPSLARRKTHSRTGTRAALSRVTVYPRLASRQHERTLSLHRLSGRRESLLAGRDGEALGLGDSSHGLDALAALRCLLALVDLLLHLAGHGAHLSHDVGGGEAVLVAGVL
jgi:hypothetical protein